MPIINLSQADMPVRTQLWENVLVLLRQAIVSGELPPGAHLLEADLAKELGVSRWPVRQAVARLEQENLVITYPNRGAYVVGFSIEHVREIYALRRLLEVYAAIEAAQRLEPAHFEQLDALAHEMGDHAGRQEADATSATDMEFHRLLFRVAGSERLRQMWELLGAPARALLIISAKSDQDLPHGIVHRHSTLIEALQTRDPAIIESVFTKHLLAAEERTIQFLEKNKTLQAHDGH